jgi:uncharacterized protein (DUF1501 family)
MPAPTRREVLRVGAAATLGLSLTNLLRADSSAAKPKATADHCILLFLNGGPSHLDMWDPKPDAPAEIRGEFKPIPTSVPGLVVGEHLPKMARLMHHAAVVRSMHHGVNNSHAAAVYCGLTGHDRGELGGGAKPDDHPAVGSVTAALRPPTANVVPYVSMPYITQEGAGGPPQPGFFGGWLGKPRDPLFVTRNPNAPDFALPELSLAADVDPTRFDARRHLANALGTAAARNPDRTLDRTLADMDGFRAKAYDLLTAQTTREAFRIDREPPKARDAYGRNVYGQSALLARRLIEAGSRVACISWAPDANATWDTHGNNFGKLKAELLPQLDAAYSALVSDLIDRGLFDRTVIAVMGEFGRTPKINAAGGRDHWNFCYSLMLAGGGFKGGYVHGASDKIGARPSTHPLTPAEIIATVYSCLGIAPDAELRDRLDRPFQVVPWGRPVSELLT